VPADWPVNGRKLTLQLRKCGCIPTTDLRCYWSMRTTLRLDSRLLDRARSEARRRNTTITALVEEGLRLVLDAGEDFAPNIRVSLPVSSAAGGTLPKIDLNDTSALLDAMEGRP
jgi:hypothetical protein